MIDFKELSAGIKGEMLEAVARSIGAAMDLLPIWSGRGPDNGVDIIFTETMKGQLHKESKKWLVQCKDKSISGKSVTKSECGEISDDVKHHKCDGYLLVTTTTASTGLKSRLDNLDISNGGTILTQVWGMYHLDLLLRKAEFSDIFKSYFPKSWKKEHKTPIEDAVDCLSTKLSAEQLDDLKINLDIETSSIKLLQIHDFPPHKK